MKIKICIYAYFMLITSLLFGQEIKRSNNWVIGFSPIVKFDFNNGNLLIDSLSLQAFSSGIASISDTNGSLAFSTSGFVILNRDGQIMNNGLDVNCPFGNILSNYYSHRSPFDQTSIIVPKKGNTYYVFSTGMSDSVANNYLNSVLTEFDVLSYCVVDMDSNAGMGKVVVKDKVLTDHQHYHYTPLTAVKHNNGRDWWLVKADCNNNRYQEFLVKEDTILGPYYQNITTTGDFCTWSSQIYFSQDGAKLASSTYGDIYGTSSNPFYYYNRVELYDFDRCSGEITYKQHYIVPYDTSTYVNRDYKQGICFSPDGKLLYMSTNYSVFQIDLEDTSTNNALFIHGPDTSDLAHFPLYGLMDIAPNGKIYVGNSNGIRKYMSYIDSPNVKGLGCHFVPQGVWQPYTNLMSPPNMPNYGLGVDNSNLGCWTLDVRNLSGEKNNEWMVYPNPASNKLIIASGHLNDQENSIELFDIPGRSIFQRKIKTSTGLIELDITELKGGVYFLRCNGNTRKVVVE